ncbi:NuA4-domain-containing protein [Sistotremastrum niveocremeum HHB9708]|uniref:Chromatin modification-related protein EAF6 n=2 Tax=Sistotremastraceae TaxID=3402574 RepID=A0A164UY41_9AGAM|nr:NuA4-domain-containing protein [Sistotremastrum niveocremeum HHB9708]KZT34589.1 NuA4-domain-containing protein [Sistotremastrum suecicum HHB10207 ss-3]
MAETDAEARAQYETAKNELVQALIKKRAADKQLAELEAQIYNFEGTYLMETSNHGGNIIQGFEGYLKSQGPGKRRYEIGEADRMFSNSSLTYTKSLELHGEAEESEADLNKYPGGSAGSGGIVTVHLPPAPKSQEMTPNQLKRERDREWQRKKRASKRALSTGSAEEPEVIPRRTTKRQKMMDDD